MIVVVDSGSTKSDWVIIDGDTAVPRVKTEGTNPFFQSSEQIDAVVREQLLPHIEGVAVTEIHFYGAGCAFPEKIVMVKGVLTHIFPEATVEVGSDLLAASRALCAHEAGIACIMGTGSNSCYYDGAEIVSNVSPLGYMLGDEGSGAVLGRLLVSDYLKKQLPKYLGEEFAKEYPISQTEIMEHVYKRPLPNRFLASFTPFLKRHINDDHIRAIVEGSFTQFVRRNILQYSQARELPIHFVGSIAYHFAPQLDAAIEAHSLKMGAIMQSPMDGLIDFHKDRLNR